MEGSSQESDIMTNSELETLMNHLTSMPQSLFTTTECVTAENPLVAQQCNFVRPDSTYNDYHYHTNGAMGHIVNSTYEVNVNRSCGPTGMMPSTEPYYGPLNFQIHISQMDRPAWAYSELLNKVFIDMNKVLLMQFKMHPQTLDDITGLKVRALLMYSTPDYMNSPVDRCTLHWASSDPKYQAHIAEECRCVAYKHAGHVLTADNEDACYEYNTQSKRHSVTVPITPAQPAFGDTSIAYQFGCKTSCQGGMGRRPTNIIFTLENSNGEVIGRQCLSVKVCSCPKRDRKREESDLAKGRENLTPAPAKRKYSVKSNQPLTPNDDNSNVFPSLRLPEVVPNGDTGLMTSCKKLKIDPLPEFTLQQQDEQQTQIQPNHLHSVQPNDFRCQQLYQNIVSGDNEVRDLALITLVQDVKKLNNQCQHLLDKITDLSDVVSSLVSMFSPNREC